MVTSTSLSYLHHVPPGPVAALFPPHAIFRVRYGDISSDGFTWSAAVSDDGGHTWRVVQTIVASREE